MTKQIIIMQSQYGDSFNSEQYENEKRIAEAAPELLAAAEIGLRYMKAAKLDGVQGSGFLTVLRAIAKAKGQ